MSTTQPRTTLATVAASAGVSVATVSKVLNGRRDVAPATRARVQEMLRAHDYGGRLKTIERHPTIELTFRGKIGCLLLRDRPGRRCRRRRARCGGDRSA